MKSLAYLLRALEVLDVIGSRETNVQGLAYDSRAVKPNDLFVALRGSTEDGHAYINEAEIKGASVIVCDTLPRTLKDKKTYIRVANTRKSLSLLASAYYAHPSRHLKIVGVTGTNGKTTLVTLLSGLFERLGHKVGLLSTIVYRSLDTQWTPTHTTPEPIALQRMLHHMKKKGCRYVFMEVSSHALDQARTHGMHFDGAIFTNLSHDHIHYHGNFSAYLSAKKRLFDALPKSAFALVNADDTHHSALLHHTKAKCYTYAMYRAADYRARVLEDSLSGLSLAIEGKQFHTHLCGVYNAYNVLAVVGAAHLLGASMEDCLTRLSECPPVTGRFEHIPNTKGIYVVLDYAHTPDALQNILKSLQRMARQAKARKLIAVIGCGGDRDKQKRPMMAQAAAGYANEWRFTADNPRSEDPLAIIADMQNGLPEKKRQRTHIETDRRRAIQYALEMASKGDIVLVAGKGHEEFQEIKGTKYPYSDRQTIQQLLA